MSTRNLIKSMISGTLRYHPVEAGEDSVVDTDLFSVKTTLCKANVLDCSLTMLHAAKVI